MDKKDLIKYAIAAAGMYMLYTYLKNHGYIDQWFGPGTVHPAVGTGTGTGTGSTQNIAAGDHTGTVGANSGVTITTPTIDPAKVAADNAAQVTATIDDSLLERAAAGAPWPTGMPTNVAAAKLTWDEWNWYAAKFNASLGMPATGTHGPEEVGITDRNTLITSKQYRDYLTAKGLSGLSALVNRGALPYAVRKWTN